ncbi:hypothetical protein [Clostridium scatologenes]|uniref:Phage structural protein n=1 Tax=Clostridium scatologenes TaxID=1548 RepID=A0A0E3K095_CLOSL|nr:hypothetical protein [Clostridium scatologenes]AKA69818.1 phage structural protein [Clostridium scatologenes]
MGNKSPGFSSSSFTTNSVTFSISIAAHTSATLIAIEGGKGTGQIKQIANINTSTNTVTIQGTWDITPDITSKFYFYSTLKSNVTSIADLSDIDIIANSSLKIRWTLSRNSVNDTSPTVSNASVTWEVKGYSGDGAWEKIGSIMLTSPISSLSFTNIPSKYTRFKITGTFYYVGTNNVGGRKLNIQFNSDTSNLVQLMFVYAAQIEVEYYFEGIIMDNIANRVKTMFLNSAIRYSGSTDSHITNEALTWNNTTEKISSMTMTFDYAGLILEADSNITLWGCCA